MSKSSFLNNKALDKANIALACIFAMITGYLLSRPLLSIAMFGFGINALRDIPPRLWVRNKWWLVSVGWVAMYAITYFWSDDKASWGIRLQTKLPFLILPLAIGFMPRFSPKQLQMITVAGLLLLVGSVCYSLSFLLMDHEAMVRNYKYDDVLPTLPGEDHVRVSLCIALFVIWSIYTWPVLQGRKIKWLVGAGIGFLVVYMHILAVRSGLLSLYLFLIGWGIYLSFVKNKLIGLAIIIAIPVFVLFSLRYVPTFRERVNYMDFTWFMFQHGDVSGNYGDINRLMCGMGVYATTAAEAKQGELLFLYGMAAAAAATDDRAGAGGAAGGVCIPVLYHAAKAGNATNGGREGVGMGHI